MSETLQKNLDEINKLPGLKKVKNEVKALVAYLQSAKERKEKGLGEGPALTLHLIFSGNPGTGKTTVARILADIYRDLGLIQGGKLVVVGECEKNIANGKCYVVEPSKASNHFNNYYYYTNENNQVYSIIVFNDKKQGDLNKCKEKISLWKDYFNNFDFTEKEPKNNSLNFVMTDAPQQNSLEIFASCYTEQFRDITSSFSIKFYKKI